MAPAQIPGAPLDKDNPDVTKWSEANWEWFDNDDSFGEKRFQACARFDDAEWATLKQKFKDQIHKEGLDKDSVFKKKRNVDAETVYINQTARKAAVKWAMNNLTQNFYSGFKDEYRENAFSRWVPRLLRATRVTVSGAVDSASQSRSSPKPKIKLENDAAGAGSKVKVESDAAEAGSGEETVPKSKPRSKTAPSSVDTTLDSGIAPQYMFPPQAKPSFLDVALHVFAYDTLPVPQWAGFKYLIRHFIEDVKAEPIQLQFSVLKQRVEEFFEISLGEDWHLVAAVPPEYAIAKIHSDNSFLTNAQEIYNDRQGSLASRASFFLIRRPAPGQDIEQWGENFKMFAMKKYDQDLKHFSNQFKAGLQIARSDRSRQPDGESPRKMRKLEGLDQQTPDESEEDFDGEEEDLPPPPQVLRHARKKKTGIKTKLPGLSIQKPIPKTKPHTYRPTVADQLGGPDIVTTIQPKPTPAVDPDDMDVDDETSIETPTPDVRKPDTILEPEVVTERQDIFDEDEHDQQIAREQPGCMGGLNDPIVIDDDNTTEDVTAKITAPTEETNKDVVPQGMTEEEALEAAMISKKSDEAFEKMSVTWSRAAEHTSPALLKRCAAFLNMPGTAFEHPRKLWRFKYWKIDLYAFQVVHLCRAKFQQIDKGIYGSINGDIMGAGKSVMQVFQIDWNHQQSEYWIDVEDAWATGDTSRHFPEDEPEAAPGELPKCCPSAEPGKYGCPCVPGSDARKARPSEGVQMMLPPPGTLLDWLNKLEDYLLIEESGLQVLMQYEGVRGDDLLRQDKVTKWAKMTEEQKHEIMDWQHQVEMDPSANGVDFGRGPGPEYTCWITDAPKGLQKYLIVQSNNAGSIKTLKKNFSYPWYWMKDNMHKDKKGNWVRYTGKANSQPASLTYKYTPVVLPTCWIGIDEAHEQRNLDTNIFKFVKYSANLHIEGARPSVHLYTGTPFSNGPSQIHGFVDVIYALSARDEDGTPMDEDQNPWAGIPELTECHPDAFYKLCKEFDKAFACKKPEIKGPWLMRLGKRFQRVLEELMVRRTYETTWNGKLLIKLPEHTETVEPCPVSDEIFDALEARYDGIKSQSGEFDKTKFVWQEDVRRLRVYVTLPALLMDEDLLKDMTTWVRQRYPGREIDDIKLGWDQFKAEEWWSKAKRGGCPYKHFIKRIAFGSSKMDKLDEICTAQAAEGLHTAVFAISPIQGYISYRAMEDKGHSCLWISAVHDMGERRRLAEEFQAKHKNEPTVIFSTPAISGRGIELTNATKVVMIERDFDICPVEQAIHRVHRIGQNKPTEALILCDDRLRIEQVMMSKDVAAKEFAKMAAQAMADGRAAKKNSRKKAEN